MNRPGKSSTEVPIFHSAAPLVSVIVCTRNRGDNVLMTAQTVLACDFPNFELLIVDQSEEDNTHQALLPLCDQEPRLRYFHLKVAGKSNALNYARQQAQGTYLLLTDDDCEVASDWIRVMVEAFEANPEVGCIFGDVQAAPCASEAGYIPDNPILHSHTIHRLRDFLRMPDKQHFGIGANMGLRKESIEALSGWDPCSGPGSMFGTGDDHDVAVRMLLAGFRVHFCAESHVLHYGLRRWENVGRDIRRIAFGFGAFFAKYLRCGKIYYGSWRMLMDFLSQIIYRGLRGHRPLGFAFPCGWISGLFAGMWRPVDRKNYCFRSPNPTERDRYGQPFALVVLRAEQSDISGLASGTSPNS